MQINTAKPKRKPKKRQVMYNAVAHHLLINTLPVPEQQSVHLGQLPLVYILGMMPYDMEYPFGQLGSAVLAVSPLNFCVPAVFYLAGHEKLKNP